MTDLPMCLSERILAGRVTGSAWLVALPNVACIAGTCFAADTELRSTCKASTRPQPRHWKLAAGNMVMSALKCTGHPNTHVSASLGLGSLLTSPCLCLRFRVWLGSFTTFATGSLQKVVGFGLASGFPLPACDSDWIGFTLWFVGLPAFMLGSGA